MSESDLEVIKQDGKAVAFDAGKLRASLEDAHAPDDVIEEIVADIKQSVDEEITSDAIYRTAYEKLKKRRKSYAAQYSLRESLAKLGPTGYPFESFVARIFEAKGFTAEVGVTLQGSCIEHEVDVVAQNEDTLAFIEAKFHNEHSIKSSVQTPLYVHSRFNDLAENDHGRFSDDGRNVEYWLVTNTKFSDQAKHYGECVGLQMIGWNHPEDKNLQTLITEASLQPVTALTTLNNAHKRELTKQNVVLCKNLRNQKEKLRELGFNDEEIAEVIDEVDHLCHV
jgi:hypothetical protein